MTSLRKKSTLKNVDSQVPKKLSESSFGEFGDLIEILMVLFLGKPFMMFLKRILNYKRILEKLQNLLMRQFI